MSLGNLAIIVVMVAVVVLLVGFFGGATLYGGFKLGIPLLALLGVLALIGTALNR